MSYENEEKRTYLGYLPSAPLPTLLDNEDFFDEMKELNLKERKEETEIDAFTNSLINFVKTEAFNDFRGKHPTINEETFVKSWLPHFYYPTSENLSVGDAWVHKVSFSPYSPVEVLREGKVIYRIPPIFAKLKPFTAKDKRVSIRQALQEHDDVVKRLPTAKELQGNIFASSLMELNDKREYVKVSAERNLRNLFVLDEIFVYYGYKSILTPEIMSLKKQVMGEKYNEYYTSGTLQSNVKSTGKPAVTEIVEDDDDLFGDD